MNDKRRKQISALKDKLAELRAGIEQIRDDEQAAFDNTAPSLQQAAAGEKMEQAVCDLEDAAESINEAIEQLEAAAQ